MFDQSISQKSKANKKANVKANYQAPPIYNDMTLEYTLRLNKFTKFCQFIINLPLNLVKKNIEL